MIHGNHLLPIAMLVLAAPCKGAPQANGEVKAYTLAKADIAPKAGMKFTVTKTLATKNATVKSTMNGQPKEGTAESTKTETISYEYLSEDKVRWIQTKGEQTQTFQTDGKTIPQRIVSPMAGQPAIANRSNGRWVSELENGKPTPPQKSVLNQTLTPSPYHPKDTVAYGTTPHKIGDTWTVQPVDFPFAGVQGSPAKGEIKITFKGIEPHDGKACARHEAAVNIQTGGANANAGPSQILEGTIYILRSLDDLIDLKSSFSGKIHASPDPTTTIDGDFEMEQVIQMN